MTGNNMGLCFGKIFPLSSVLVFGFFGAWSQIPVVGSWPSRLCKLLRFSTSGPLCDS